MSFVVKMLEACFYSLFIPEDIVEQVKKDCDKWKTKDGREIKVEDLEDDHLLNIIRHLRNHGRVSFETWNNDVVKNLNFPEAESTMSSFEFQVAFVRGPNVWLDIMKDEAAKRGLDIKKAGWK